MSDLATTDISQNPLIQHNLPHGAPAFGAIENAHFIPAIDYAIEKAAERIAVICANPEAPTFQNTIEAFEFARPELQHAVNALENIGLSNSSSELSEIETVCNQTVTKYSDDMYLNAALFKRVETVYKDRANLSLSADEAMLLNETYKRFVRSGAALDPEAQTRLREINERLTGLKDTFRSNVTKALGAYRRVVTDESELDGVPERAKNNYRDAAQKAQLPTGSFLIKLQPEPNDIMQHATNRALRAEISIARNSVCYHDEWDNTEIAFEIMKLRHESAQLKGYETHADFVVSDRMAGSRKAVTDFLENNMAIYLEAAEAEFQELRDIALERDGITDLKAWDVPYYARMIQEQKFAFQLETLRPYFGLENVLEGLRQHAERLFNIEMRVETTGKYPVYHSDVQTFEVFDKVTGAQIGVFYGDYFARPGNKKPGAWEAAIQTRGVVGNEEQLPIVINNTNFSEPALGKPSLLAVDNLRTLFHEFGHASHDLLAEGPYPSLNGTHVKWDFVELPSHLMENWVRDENVLASFARHYETGEPITPELIAKMKEADNFSVGRLNLRQSSLGLLDMMIHSTDPSTVSSIEEMELRISERAEPIKRSAGIQAVTFTHIFSSDYDAGYYSYKWAATMEADIFEAFEERGLYDPTLSARLRETIYAKGGRVEPQQLFVDLMGRNPDFDAIFRREGLLPKKATQSPDRKSLPAAEPV